MSDENKKGDPTRLQQILLDLHSVQQSDATGAVQAIIERSCDELRALNARGSIEPLISFFQEVLDSVLLSAYFAAREPSAKALRMRIRELQDEARALRSPACDTRPLGLA